MSEQIITLTEPGEGFNTDFITTYELHNRQRNSVIYLLLHTAVGGIPGNHIPEDCLFYEDLMTYVSDENGVKLQVE